jgi:hypothetical protein
MASPEKLKKYQKEKFDSYKKINNLKVNDNEAYIEMKVKDYNSIISEYSLEDSPVLKKEFLNVIENRASVIPLDYPLVLEIHNSNFSSEEKIVVRKLIKNHFTFISINKESELKRLRQKSRFLLLLGIILLIVSKLIENITFFVPIFEILNILTWVGIWECISLVLFDEDNLKEEIIKYKHLSKIRVVYNKEKIKKE